MVQVEVDVKTDNVKCGTGIIHSFRDELVTFEPDYPRITLEGYLEAFGIIMFAFGGISIFPTIQADMKDKPKFKFSAYLAMIGMYCNESIVILSIPCHVKAFLHTIYKLRETQYIQIK